MGALTVADSKVWYCDDFEIISCHGECESAGEDVSQCPHVDFLLHLLHHGDG